MPVDEVPPLALNPRNNTALLDSMGKLITYIAAEITALAEGDKPGSIILGDHDRPHGERHPRMDSACNQVTGRAADQPIA